MRKLLLFICLNVAAFAQTDAINYVPSSVEGRAFTFVIESGTPPFATSGTANILFGASSWSLTNVEGDIDPSQTSTYTYETAESNICYVYSNNTILGASVMKMTYTGSGVGTFQESYTKGGEIHQSGTFSELPYVDSVPDSAIMNMSVRTALSAGGIVTPGFVIGGNEPRTVLIRGLGPKLKDYGVGNAMNSTRLRVFKGSDLIAQATKWNSNLIELFTKLGAGPLNEGSKDSALVLTLDPGVYTAQLGSTNSTAVGEVLLEVFLVK